MIPSTTLSTPSLPTQGFPARPLSANLSSPPLTSLAQRRRNNKNLSLRLSSTDPLSPIPPSTPFLPTFSSSPQHRQQDYYQHGPIAILPGLYLGDEHNASNVQQLKDLSIHCVINVAAEVDHPYAHLFQPWDQVFLNTSNNSAITATPCPTLSSSSSSSSASSTSSNSTLTIPPPPSPPSSWRSASVYNAMGYKKRPWHHHILDDNDNDNDNDDDQQSIQKELHAAVLDVVRARQSGRNVLVHCQCGLARSATVVVAYVMYVLRLSMSAAVLHVKNHAPHINPNLSLMYRLREYELWLLVTRPAEERLDPVVTTTTTTTRTTTPTVMTNKKITNASSFFLRKHQSSTSCLVAKCKSFKFNKSSVASSPYITSLRQDFSWRSSSSSK